MGNERHDVTPATQPAYYAMPPASDEVSLIDLWLILVRRRWWFVGTFAVIMGAVIGFLVVARPLYASRATIQIGQVTGTLLESPGALVSRLRAEYDLDNADTGTIEPPKVTNVSSGNNDHGLVTIKARGYSAKQARDFLQRTVQKILNGQQHHFDRAMSARKQHLASLQQQQKQLQSQVNTIGKRLEADPTTGGAFVLTWEQGTLLQQISAIQSTIANVRQSMTLPQSMPTALLHPPSLPVRRASPRTLLTLVLGIVGACLAALLAAFGAEFFSQARAEMKRRAGIGA